MRREPYDYTVTGFGLLDARGVLRVGFAPIEILRRNCRMPRFNGICGPTMVSVMELEFTIPVSVQEVDESTAGWPYRKPPDFAALVQDRASEMITHCDNAERVEQIGNELYSLAERVLGRELDGDETMRRHDIRELKSIYNRMGGVDD